MIKYQEPKHFKGEKRFLLDYGSRGMEFIMVGRRGGRSRSGLIVSPSTERKQEVGCEQVVG